MVPSPKQFKWSDFYYKNMIVMFLVWLAPLLAFFVKVEPAHWLVAILVYSILMFAVTAGYHRYFAHKTYKMGRAMQFLMGVLASTSGQNSILWWAAHHRHHHQFSDTEEDVHSPVRGFLWSHFLWIYHKDNHRLREELIPDLMKFPELVLLHKYWYVPAIVFSLMMYAVGGAPMLLIGYALPVLLSFHATFTINSLMHVFGRRVYATDDTSKNSAVLAFLTFGEGWHNNHHYFAGSTAQGFRWYEFDFTLWILKFMQKFGLVHSLRLPTEALINSNLISEDNPDPAIERVEALRSQYLPRRRTIWGWSFYVAALVGAIALGVLLVVFGALKGMGAAYIVGVSLFLAALVMFYSVKIVEWVKAGSQSALNVIYSVDIRFLQILVAAAFSPVIMLLPLGIAKWFALAAMWTLAIAIISVPRYSRAWSVLQSAFVIGLATAIYPLMGVVPQQAFLWLAASVSLFFFAYKIRPYFHTMRLNAAYAFMLMMGTVSHFIFLNDYLTLATL